jgi:MFS transporter, DHA2 family, multidrug resistance protein
MPFLSHPFYLISCILVFLSSADLTSAILASYYMVRSLGAEQYQTIWMITSYLVGSGLGVIGSSYLNNTFDLKRSLCLSIFGFCTFNLLCFLSAHYYYIVFFRGVIGFFSAAVFVTVVAISECVFNLELRARLGHIWSCLITIGIFFGLNFGAFVADEFSFRAIFVIKALLFLLLLFALEFTLPCTLRMKNRRHFNGISFLLFSGFLIGSQILLDTGYQLSWFKSSFFLTIFLLTSTFFVLFMLHERVAKETLFNYSIIRNREFVELAFIVGSSFGVGLGALTGFAGWLFSCYNYSVLWISLALSFSGILPIFSSLFMDKLLSRYSARALAIFCYTSLSICLLVMLNFNNYLEFWMIATLRFSIGIFFALWLPTLTVLLLQSFDKVSSCSALANFTIARFILASFILSLFTNVEMYRKIHHSSNLVQALNRYPQAQAEYLEQIMHYVKGQSRALSVLLEQIENQAQTLAAIDVWFVSLLLMLLVIFILIVGRKGLKKEKISQ